MEDDLAAGILNRDGQLVEDSVECAVRVADVEDVISHASEDGVGKGRVSALDVKRVAAAAQEDKQLVGDGVVNRRGPRTQNGVVGERVILTGGGARVIEGEIAVVDAGPRQGVDRQSALDAVQREA